MSKQIYNSLSADLQQKHQVKYSEYRGDEITTFKNEDDQWGAFHKNAIIVPPVYDSIYYDTTHRFFKCVRFHGTHPNTGWTYEYFNQEGHKIAALENIGYMRVDDYGQHFYRLPNRYLWGVMNKNFRVLMEPIYEDISALSATLYKAKVNGLWGIIDQKKNIVLEFKASEIIGNFSNTGVLAEIDQHYFQINSHGQIMQELPFTFLLKPSSNSYWWRHEQDKEKLKSVVNGKKREETDDFYPFDELTEYTGQWGIVDQVGKVLIEATYDYIDFFGLSKNYKVFRGVISFSEDNNSFKTLLKGAKCGVITPKNEILIPIMYDWINEIAENLWAVNLGGTVFYNDEYQEDYWTVKGGKWGVINQHSQIIVPVQYDNLMTNWYRIKDLIIVQNGAPSFDHNLAYDAYDFAGNQLDSSKISYKNHIFYNGS